MAQRTTPRKAYYVLSTHWDREWYEPFQFYRFRLVQLLDRVLDGIADGRLKGPFQTDGQSIVLEDYLEIRPERRAQVEQFAREGKLIIGPWYVLPDEFLVSGESHIRNLQLGRRIAREFGAKPSNVGFVCDLFGHISQLPQIFANFGIGSGFVWRGINIDSERHFVWEGADGSELICYKYCNVGYCDYAFKVRDADKFDVTFSATDKLEKMKSYVEFEASETVIDPILIFDGGDHQEWDDQTYAVLVQKMEESSGPHEIYHTSLDEYAAAMIEQRDRIKLRQSGELREPGRTPMKASHLIPGVLSSRVWIKQQNADCQNALTLWAEPLATFASLALKLPYPTSYLDVAWKHLLQNHPHDSICGCSVDQVHEDMKYRFSQCAQIAERLILESMRKISASVEQTIQSNELRVTVFNPLSIALDEPVDLVLDTPDDWPMFGEFFNFEMKPAFVIVDEKGKEVPYQRTGQSMKRIRTRIHDAKFPQHYHVNEVKVTLPLHVPAMGYAALTVRPSAPNVPTRYPQDRGIATTPRTLENEKLLVRVERNGTLTITSRQTGDVFEEVLAFEERADIGDGWFHGVAVNDEIQISTASHADVAVVENGPLMAALRVRVTMRIPKVFDFATMRRSEDRTEFVIDSTIRLRKGNDYLEIETRIDNNADDHRVRALFPTGADADTFLTDTPFDVVERPIEIRADNHLYAEMEVETKPQQSFTAAFDKNRGLAVISTGQMETAVLDSPERPIALTLFRGTRRTVLTDGQPNGELRGPMTFKYYVKVLGADGPNVVELFQLGQKIGAGVRIMQQRIVDVDMQRTTTNLPAVGSLLSVDGDAILTSVRQVADGIEVRAFNPLGRSSKCTLHTPFATTFKKAASVDFEGYEKDDPVTLENSGASCKLRPKQITTIRLS